VGNQFPPFGQLLGVDAVGAHPSRCLEGDGAGEHQGNEQVIAAAGLCRQENGGQGRAQDARQQTGHSGQHEVPPDEVPTREYEVGHSEVDATEHGAAEQGGGENAPYASCTDGQAGQGRLAEPQDAHHEQQFWRGPGNELANALGVQPINLAAEKVVDQVETLTIQGGKSHKCKTDEAAGNDNTRSRVAEPAHGAAGTAIDGTEPDGSHAAQGGERDEREKGAIPCGQVAPRLDQFGGVDEQSRGQQGRKGGDEEGDEAGRGQVEHDDLHSKYDGGQRSVEHGSQRGRGRASDEHEPVSVVQFESLGDLRGHGCTALNGWGLQSGTTTESHGDEGGGYRAYHGHARQPRPQTRYGMEGGGNAWAGVAI